jgi:PhnB protein
MKIPEGYQQVMPYLIVKGAARFLHFMKIVFGAEEKMKVMRDENIIMHAELRIGDSVIMFADATSQFEPRPAGIFVYVEDADQTFNKAIAEGATSVMPMSDREYGRSGGVIDPFGNVWWPTTPPRATVERQQGQRQQPTAGSEKAPVKTGEE